MSFEGSSSHLTHSHLSSRPASPLWLRSRSRSRSRSRCRHSAGWSEPGRACVSVSRLARSIWQPDLNSRRLDAVRMCSAQGGRGRNSCCRSRINIAIAIAINSRPATPTTPPTTLSPPPPPTTTSTAPAVNRMLGSNIANARRCVCICGSSLLSARPIENKCKRKLQQPVVSAPATRRVTFCFTFYTRSPTASRRTT